MENNEALLLSSARNVVDYSHNFIITDTSLAESQKGINAVQ